MFAPRITETMLSVNGGPFPNDKWTNNAGLTQLMHDGIFKLNDLPNHFQYTTLFDAYRINAVKIEFITNANVTSTAVDHQMIAYNFTDWSGQVAGGAAMPAESQLLTMQRCRRRQAIAAKPLKVYSKLRQLSVMHEAAGGLTYGYGRVKPRWISTAEPGLEHFGLITIWTNASSGVLPTVSMRATITYYIECRGVK